MKINCIGKLLKDCIVIADRNTSKNQTLPILSSILLTAKNNDLSIKSTNLDTAIEINIPSKVEQQGSVVVSGKILSAFISASSDDQILLQSQKENIYIKTKTTETTIRGFSSDDFPLFPSIEPLFSITLSVNDLLLSLQRVIVSVSLSDMKPELASIFFKIIKNTITVAATDSFRLAQNSLIIKSLNIDTLISFLLPNHSAQELIHILQDINENNNSPLNSGKDIDILINKNQICFQNKRFRYISRLTEGVFPDYEQIIPKSFKMEAIVKRSDVINNIKVASIFSSRLNDILLNFDEKQKMIIFHTSNNDTGEHTSKLNVSIQGDSYEAKFNWHYLLDGILQISSEYIVFGFNGEQSPLLLKPKGDSSYIYLIMPMRGL